MNVDHLVKMANEIASFFVSESPPERAPQDVATHLRRYWEPRMRRAMLEHYRRGGAGLSDLARAGVAILAAEAAAASAQPAAAPSQPPTASPKPPAAPPKPAG